MGLELGHKEVEEEVEEVEEDRKFALIVLLRMILRLGIVRFADCRLVGSVRYVILERGNGEVKGGGRGGGCW